jgi:hypothetical protein
MVIAEMVMQRKIKAKEKTVAEKRECGVARSFGLKSVTP